MPEEFSPQVTSEMSGINTVARRSENLNDQSRDVASNLYGIDRATKNIQAIVDIKKITCIFVFKAREASFMFRAPIY